ncbi:N-formylglutamate deformylase [Aestuariivita boseongensis]|uniref:N-formylglutamate deformylase n=1 Tax=Aestuariivita boseongensis TaxID=1470562 RepID=UPI000681BD07|nr:N-formylglutamate deformylase [Aestuariivita boseongensis]
MIEVTEGQSPVILGLPHTGTWLPEDVTAKLNATGRALADTDWHIDRLYDGLLDGVTTVRTPVHRYVIDVNRDPDGASLYPGQNTTGLVPLTDFDGVDIWDTPPSDADIRQRCDDFHRPYHAALSEQMDRVKALHGFAILYDCHSIRGEIPFLFDGQLPDLNIGTNLSTTCDPAIEALVKNHCRAASEFSTTLNGRFKGGWTTRHYGRPDQGWHAIQMELAQRCYLTAEAPPWTYDPAKADTLRATLRAILTDLSRWRPQ